MDVERFGEVSKQNSHLLEIRRSKNNELLTISQLYPGMDWVYTRGHSSVLFLTTPIIRATVVSVVVVGFLKDD